MAYPATVVRTERTAAIASRALGVAFIVTSITTALYLVPTFKSMGQTEGQTGVSESYWDYLFPCIFEMTAGLVFLLFSRTAGRWLARGLAD